MSSVENKMPAKIKRLPELSRNLWWSWTPNARELWRRLDYPLWRETEHNPVKLLQEVSPEKLAAAAADGAFRRLYDRVMIEMDRAMSNDNSWFAESYPDLADQTIAYFSFEFGIHNTLPIYSGGLGILSGDHTKEGSDLGLPLVCVGFMYPQGYFRQRVPSHGWQEAVYQHLDFGDAPISPLQNEHGETTYISIKIGEETVSAKVWLVKVGRTKLYLLDTDVESNSPWNRELTSRLYYGGGDMRIKQEMLLGIGGVKLLRSLGYQPAVWHMNEGHSAFLLLELLREKVLSGTPFAEAKKEVAAHTVFTTHTPVPAGHDAFAPHMMERFFWGWWDQLGISRDEFMKLGEHQQDWGMAFNMTALPLRLSGFANGVSQLHGEVSRGMWKSVFTGIENDDDVPISAVTNGVHVPTWVSGEMWALFDKYLGPDWLTHQDDPLIWQRVADIPDQELWRAHVILKGKLMTFLQNKERRRWVNGQHDPTQMMVGGMLLDRDALTIGFARRFATYKRAALIFKDLERLKRIVLDMNRPVQILFAGKAHPADDPGKHVIQEVYNYAKSNQLGGRIAFLEDYDMHAARYMKQGVDVWLNNPRRPREASGTSGMKAAMNGVPNLSILDGWWVEGYNGQNGWPIGENRDYDNTEQQDWDDANSMYDTLENEIVPLYYDRDRDDIPRGWIEVMKESIRSTTPQFSMRRMLKDYVENLYVPAMRGEGKLKLTE
jgi:starch phosphorylase